MGEPFALEPFLQVEVERVERALGEVAARAAAAAVPALRAPLAYALETRGKRVRPVLCCAAFRAVAGRDAPEGVYRLACAVELVHAYSLVHDDLPCMDDDDLRRGRPTPHRVFGTPAAVLAGAALLPLSIGLLDREAALLGLAPEVRGQLVRALCAAAGATGMVGGQFRDLQAEAGVTEAAELEAIHRAKTGKLLAASLRVGALAAGAERAVCDALQRYGESLGLAFQIVDDLLDVVGDAALLGKAAGRDASLGKATYPAQFGVDGARARAGERIADALAALRDGGIRSPELTAIARYVLSRRH